MKSKQYYRMKYNKCHLLEQFARHWTSLWRQSQTTYSVYVSAIRWKWNCSKFLYICFWFSMLFVPLLSFCHASHPHSHTHSLIVQPLQCNILFVQYFPQTDPSHLCHTTIRNIAHKKPERVHSKIYLLQFERFNTQYSICTDTIPYIRNRFFSGFTAFSWSFARLHSNLVVGFSFISRSLINSIAWGAVWRVCTDIWSRWPLFNCFGIDVVHRNSHCQIIGKCMHVSSAHTHTTHICRTEHLYWFSELKLKWLVRIEITLAIFLVRRVFCFSISMLHYRQRLWTK